MRGCLVRYLNNDFQCLNNITRISTYFFTYTYFKKIQITLIEQYYQTPQAITNYVQFLFVNRRIACCLSKISIQFSTLRTRLDNDEMHLFFFFFLRSTFLWLWWLFQWVTCIVHVTHKPLFSTKLSLKIGPMALFIHLKIILL